MKTPNVQVIENDIVIIAITSFLVLIVIGVCIWQIIVTYKKRKNDRMKEIVNYFVEKGTTPKFAAYEALSEVYKVYANEVLMPDKFEQIYEEYRESILFLAGLDRYCLYSKFKTTSMTLMVVSNDTYLVAEKLFFLNQIREEAKRMLMFQEYSKANLLFCMNRIRINYLKGDDIQLELKRYIEELENYFYLYFNRKSYYLISKGKPDYDVLKKEAPFFNPERIKGWKPIHYHSYVAVLRPTLTHDEKEKLNLYKFEREIQEKEKYKNSFMINPNSLNMDLGRVINNFRISDGKTGFDNKTFAKMDKYYQEHEKEIYDYLVEKYEEHLPRFKKNFLFDIASVRDINYEMLNEAITYLLTCFTKQLA